MRLHYPLYVLYVALLVLFLLGGLAGWFINDVMYPCIALPPVTTERVVRDTIEVVVPVPSEPVVKYRTIVKTLAGAATIGDTSVRLDTATREVSIPISSRLYVTDEYAAKVSGFRATLDSLSIFRKTVVRTVTETKIKKPWLAVSAGGGVGYTTDKKILPFIGLSVGVVLWSK